MNLILKNNNNKFRLTINCYNKQILLNFITAVKREFNNAHVIGPILHPYRKKVFCVLRSPFSNKDSRDHFEIRFYSAVFICKFNTYVNALKFIRLLFKKLSFKFTNNIFISLEKS